MTEATEVGIRILVARRRLGWTQAQLAQRAGVSVHQVSYLERGLRRRPAPGMVEQLARALGVSVETLLSSAL